MSFSHFFFSSFFIDYASIISLLSVPRPFPSISHSLSGVLLSRSNFRTYVPSREKLILLAKAKLSAAHTRPLLQSVKLTRWKTHPSGIIFKNVQSLIVFCSSSNLSFSFARNIPHASTRLVRSIVMKHNFLSSLPCFPLFLKKWESCTLVTSLSEVTRVHMKNRSVLKDGWEDVQGGSAIPKRYDLPHGDFLKFFLFLLSLSLLSLLPCSARSNIFFCTGTNFRKYITSYKYPQDIFEYTKLYKESNVLSRDETLARWIYFLRGSVRFLFLFDRDCFFETRGQ